MATIKSSDFLNSGNINGSNKSVQISKKQKEAILEHIENENLKLSEAEVLENRLYALKRSIERYLKGDDKSEFISIDYFISYLIESFELSKRQFAIKIDVQPSNLNAVMKEKRPLNLELAFKLGHLSKTDWKQWLEISFKNKLAKSKPKSKSEFRKIISTINLDLRNRIKPIGLPLL